MDSILVVCYSYTGISRRAAGLLAAHKGWPLGEIRDARPRAGFAGAMRCLLDSLLRRRPAIEYCGPQPADFHTVVVVSPVWAWHMAGPMRSFLYENAARMRRYAQVTTMNASGESNAVAEAADIMGRAPVLTAGFRQREIEDGSATDRLFAFGDALLPGSTAMQVESPARMQQAFYIARNEP